MPAKYIPNGYNTTTPYLIIKGASQAIEFYTKIFGAKEIMRMGAPNGQVGHAELQIGDSRIMLADEMPEMGYRGPQALGGSPVSLLVYVHDVDKVFANATSAGAKVERPVENQFYGDRSGTIKDPFGHVWTIATHIEDVPPDELNRRAKAFMERCAQQAHKTPAAV